jgi:hypothetical protein
MVSLLEKTKTEQKITSEKKYKKLNLKFFDKIESDNNNKNSEKIK